MINRYIQMFFLILVLWNSSALGVETLTIPGTGACEVLVRQLAAAYNEQQDSLEVIVPPSVGSGGGIKKVLTGKYELARVARPLKKTESIKSMYYQPFARDPVVFAVGRGVTLKGLTAEQLAAIFSGKLTNWSEVGGLDKKIRVLIREQSDSSLAIIRQNMPLFADIMFSRRARMVYHDFEMQKMLNKFKYSIGWLTFSTSEAITGHALALDSLAPTEKSYPLQIEYAFVFKKKKTGREARSFIDFVFSTAGQTVLQNQGLLPVERK